jgi:hypothetical protein
MPGGGQTGKFPGKVAQGVLESAAHKLAKHYFSELFKKGTEYIFNPVNSVLGILSVVKALRVKFSQLSVDIEYSLPDGLVTFSIK